MTDSDLPELTAEQKIDIHRQVADAKLGVAEDLAWHGMARRDISRLDDLVSLGFLARRRGCSRGLLLDRHSLLRARP